MDRRFTQRSANAAPPWPSARRDEYSHLKRSSSPFAFLGDSAVFSRAMSWPLISLAVIISVLTLTPASYASPPDPSWISGLYDNADYDDVVVLIAEHIGVIEPGVSALSGGPAIGRRQPATTDVSPRVPLSCGPGRAPPPA